MKHISEFIAPKMRALEQLERKTRTFPAAFEKGFREWSAFNTIQDDIVHAYPVRLPQKAIVVKEQHHVLRITYPPMHQLRRV